MFAIFVISIPSEISPNNSYNQEPHHLDDPTSRSSTQVKLPMASELLFKMHSRKISPTLVVKETVFDSEKSAIQAIKALSQSALNLNIPEMISELGQAQVSVLPEDALKDVPQVNPVMREAVCSHTSRKACQH